MGKKITIGSRGSKLALLYAEKAKDAIIQNTDLNDDSINATKGDQMKDTRLLNLVAKLILTILKKSSKIKVLI